MLPEHARCIVEKRRNSQVIAISRASLFVLFMYLKTNKFVIVKKYHAAPYPGGAKLINGS